MAHHSKMAIYLIGSCILDSPLALFLTSRYQGEFREETKKNLLEVSIILIGNNSQ